jgi:hypothetical protein
MDQDGSATGERPTCFRMSRLTEILKNRALKENDPAAS